MTDGDRRDQGSPLSETSAVEAALQWARDRYAADVTIVDRRVLEGGVSGAGVERLVLQIDRAGSEVRPPVAVVVKHTSRAEVDVLRLLAGLDEPAIPQLLVSHARTDTDTAWMVVPWYPGEPIGLMAEVPVPIAALMARFHSGFMGRADEWPTTLERIDSTFVRRSLTQFVRRWLDVLPADTPTAFHERTASLAARLLADEDFVNAGATFPATVLHGDLYGLNVLRDGPGALMLIDWNAARVGPGMFDIALSISTASSPSLHAYEAEWSRIGGVPRDLITEFDWSLTLANATFAATVACRSSLRDGVAMLDAAEAAHDRQRR